jgi:hypothetical protein
MSVPVPVPAPAPVATTASAAPAVAAVAAPTAVALPVPAVPSTSPRHPNGARHLDSMMLQGRTLVYPHPRDPARYGDVRLTFVNDRVDASNRVSKASGYYHVVDDQLCISLDAWGPICLYVVDGDDPAHAERVRVLFEPSGRVQALRFE